MFFLTNYITHKKLWSDKKIIVFISLFLFIFPVSSVVFANFEESGDLNASTYLKPEFRKGPYHTVSEAIANDGFLNHYQVTSPFGDFNVESDTSLYRLIHELQAIALMQEVDTEDVALESLKKSGEKTVSGLHSLFNDPESALQGAASGVQSLFHRAKETVGRRQVTAAEDNRAEQLIGLTKSKGEIATHYGVSIYSHNTALQQELDRLARADYLGGLGVGLATSAVPGFGGTVLTVSGTSRLLNEAVNTTPASELWLQNKSKLVSLGIHEDTAELFLNNPVFDPAHATNLVVAVEKMQYVNNRELAIKVALQAHDFAMVQLITENTTMLSWYHNKIKPLSSIQLFGRLTCGIDKDVNPIIALPVDYMTWNKQVSDLANSLTNKYRSTGGNIQLWLTGQLSDLARKNLHDLGWSIHEKARDNIIKQGSK